MVTTEDSSEISKINNKTLMDSSARLLAASKSKVTIGKKTSGQVILGAASGQVIPFDLASNEYPLFVGQSYGSAGNITGSSFVDGDKNKIFIGVGGLGFNGYVELYYIRIS